MCTRLGEQMIKRCQTVCYPNGHVISMVHLFNRDEAQAKMILLKEKADKDLQQHNAEMKEHVRIIDHDKKLRDFMNTKCKERQEDPQLVAWRQRKGKCHIFDKLHI